jgi:hypothetical protein
MTSPPHSAALYANGTAPLFLDTAEVTFTFADGPPVRSVVEVAHVNYQKNTATIVFCEGDHEALDTLALPPYFHTTVSLDQLQDPKRAEDANPELEISHEMQVTLHMLAGGKQDFDPCSHLEGLIASSLKERQQMLHAEDAIRNIGRDQARGRAKRAREARSKALTKLARLSDAQALSLLEGNRLPDSSGVPRLAATLQDVRNRRNHLLSAAHMMRRLARRHAQRPLAGASKRELRQRLHRA